MPLGPRIETCVQPAPKSRLAVFGLFAYEDQGQIKSFPAKAGPTGKTTTPCGTGFSRESVGSHTAKLMARTPPDSADSPLQAATTASFAWAGLLAYQDV
jgi:hypothetical protein